MVKKRKQTPNLESEMLILK